MINYTRKWWFLRCLRKAEKIHSTRGSADGNRILLSQRFFIQGNIPHSTDPWNGLANKFNRYVWFRPSWILWWKKEYPKKKLAKKVNDYNDIYEVCFQEGYIRKDENTGYPTVSTPIAYKIRSFPLGYLQGLLNEYGQVWVVVGAICGMIITFLLGISVK